MNFRRSSSAACCGCWGIEAVRTAIDGLTRHAQARMQQRGIPVAALACLLDYGRETHDHRGSVVVYFDKAARRRLAQEAAPGLRPALSKITRTYAVLSDGGEVITVGHRFRRIARN